MKNARYVQPIVQATVFTISQSINFAYIKILHKNSVKKANKFH